MTSNLSRAQSALRMPAPADVVAWARLDESDPEIGPVLRDAVIRVAAVTVTRDLGEVTGLAVLAVARHYAGLGDDRTVAHAARLAVRLAEQTVTLSRTPDVVSVDWQDDDVRVRLENWQATRPDSYACPSDLRELVGALLARREPTLVDPWGEIADSWLAHDVRSCARCVESVARTGKTYPVTLATVRAHVAGIPVTDKAYAAGKKSDGRCVARVMAALESLRGRIVGETVRRGDHSPAWGGLPVGVGSILSLVYGQAWEAVERGDSRDYAGIYGAPVAPVMPVRVGATVRNLSEREAEAAARPTARLARPVPFPGEYDDRSGSAPIGNRDRRDDGQVLSFKPVVSPRKRAPKGAVGGPTMPVRLSR